MSIEELKNDPSYSLLLVLPHDDILSFLSKYLHANTLTMRVYFGLLLLLAAIQVSVAALDVHSGQLDFWALLKYFCIGALPGFLVLVPLHEGLHGLAYKLSGAGKISFGVNWRFFYFYAVADRFVASRRVFVFVALFPFIVISLLLIIPLFFVPLPCKWVLMGALFLHTTACAGDFAMMAFYEHYRQAKELLTFDVVAEKRSYFYVRE
ncbi:MAG TPA: DUF3267 domain-containing protein [Bacteroidetes bacterium]|nr:DUF3267 domain-containing protein [Bacteroidota bacterium]